MQPAINPRWDRPIFVASMGRSGSTLLQRVLNVHPDLTIWGEHGAFLKGILESYEITNDEAIKKNLADGYDNRGSVVGELSDKEVFKPWVSPFRTEDLANGVRSLVRDLFTTDLAPTTRWGFKEIRYTEEELGSLMELFPEGHLIVLGRDVPGYAMSRFFAFGQTDFDLSTEDGRAKASLRLTNMINGWIRRYQGLLELSAQHPDRSSLVAYSDLVPGSDRPQSLLAELGESPARPEAIEAVLGAKSGSSFRHNEAARANRDQLVEVIANAEYDRAEVARISDVIGLK